MPSSVKAIVLVSGGLDSALTLKLLHDQGIDLIAVNFAFPTLYKAEPKKSYAQKVADKLKIPFKRITIGEDYVKLIKNPKHGRGSAINPCIDCKIYMLKKVKKMMKELKADFAATGEVLGQRPMSQHLQALNTIEKQSGLKGRLLRPLCAAHLPETEVEKKGLVDRKKLYGIKGRGRKIQMEMARDFGITEYSSPAGGCFLTDKPLAAKFMDLFERDKSLKWKDLLLLRVGRHFRSEDSKIIVGRNEKDNNLLEANKDKSDYVFQAKDYMGPTTLLKGKKTKQAIEFAARLTLLYSDCEDETGVVAYNHKKITVAPLSKREAAQFNLSLN